MRLREILELDTTLSLSAAAAELRLAPRTLQHQLAAAGTSFRAEQHAVRLRRAKSLLAGDDSITSIALEIGCSSSQHFGAWFRAATGLTPGEWRRRR